MVYLILIFFLGGFIMKKFLLFSLALLLLASCTVTEKVQEEYTFTEEVIMVDGGDHMIPATLTIPNVKEGEKVAAVVMCHGNGSTRHEAGNAYDYTAPELAKAGIASIRFDYIGNGDSTGDYIDYTHYKGVEDAITCKEYLKTLSVIDSDRIGVMGWSQGGRVALLTAAADDSFKSVVTWAGAYGVKPTDKEEYEVALKDGFYEVTYSWRDSLKQSPAYYECSMNIDYPAEAAKITAPYLLIQGTNDTSVVPETANTVFAALTSSVNKSIFWVDGSEHTFGVFTPGDTTLETITAETVSWFKETL